MSDIIKIEKILRKEYSDEIMTSHAEKERVQRIMKANDLICKENAKLADSFMVDKGHKRGTEIHNVYTNGIIKIYNSDSKKLVTMIIATPNQAIRYYHTCGIDKIIPVGMIEHCKAHRAKNRNR